MYRNCAVQCNCCCCRCSYFLSFVYNFYDTLSYCFLFGFCRTLRRTCHIQLCIYSLPSSWSPSSASALSFHFQIRPSRGLFPTDRPRHLDGCWADKDAGMQEEGELSEKRFEHESNFFFVQLFQPAFVCQQETGWAIWITATQELGLLRMRLPLIGARQRRRRRPLKVFIIDFGAENNTAKGQWAAKGTMLSELVELRHYIMLYILDRQKNNRLILKNNKENERPYIWSAICKYFF